MKCPSCGGRGHVPSPPYGEPDGCAQCFGTGECEPEADLDEPIYWEASE